MNLIRLNILASRSPKNLPCTNVELGSMPGTGQYFTIEFAFIEGAERALEIFFAADGVAIQPSDASLGEHPVQKFFQLF